MKRWYVVLTHCRKEAFAAEQLAKQGFEVYLPRYAKLVRHARRQTRVLAPLFPRYLFVAADIGRDRWRALCSTRGVSLLIGNDDGPTPISDMVVEEIRGRESTEGLVTLIDPRKIERGAPVRITGGPFVDRTGLFECMDDSQRVVLLLNLLHRDLRIKVPAADIDFAA